MSPMQVAGPRGDCILFVCFLFFFFLFNSHLFSFISFSMFISLEIFLVTQSQLWLEERL